MKSIKDFKIKELILHNFALKILAIVIAVVSWIVIVNIDNPSQRVTISGIPVNLVNQETLYQKGYTFQVESGSTATIVIKAPRNIAEQLKTTDFYAYADLSERSPDSDKSKIYVSCVKDEFENQVDIVNIKTEYLQLSIDNKVDKNLPLEVVITGTPSEGHVVGDYSTSPTSIRVSGAENIISRIESAKVTYNVDNMNAEIDDSVVPVFYDADGNVINSDKLEISRQSIKLKIDILPTKTIDIKYIVSGDPKDGYELSGYTSDVSSIVIAGKQEKLDQISSLDIPAGVIDASEITENTSVEVSLAAYLPADYFIVSQNTVMHVQLSVEKYEEKTINIPIDRITVTGRDDDYEYDITNENGGTELDVEIRAVESKIQSITYSDLKAAVDVSSLRVGYNKVTVELVDDEDIQIAGTYSIIINKHKKESESEGETETDSDENPTSENESTEEDSDVEEDLREESYVSDGNPTEDLEEETGIE